jgi:hypothetical protein
MNGEPDEQPKNNESLLREILSVVDDERFRRKLRVQNGPLRAIQNVRNQAAHASLDGAVREVDPCQFRSLAENLSVFFGGLLELWVEFSSKGRLAS